MKKPTVRDISPDHRALSVPRRTGDSSREVPAPLQDAIAKQALMGENAALARRAVTTDFGRSYYVVPGRDDAVCLFSNTGSGGCFPVRTALTGEASGTEVCAPHDPGQYIQFGMVPDEAGNEVIVEYADGRVDAVAVKDNVYAFAAHRSAALPVQISWSAPGGKVGFTPYVASDVATADCG